MGANMEKILKPPAEVLVLPKSKYPFEDMGVGDALFFDSFKAAESARVSSIYFVKVKQPAWRFSTRKNSGGWWVYRTR